MFAMQYTAQGASSAWHYMARPLIRWVILSELAFLCPTLPIKALCIVFFLCRCTITLIEYEYQCTGIWLAIM